LSHLCFNFCTKEITSTCCASSRFSEPTISFVTILNFSSKIISFKDVWTTKMQLSIKVFGPKRGEVLGGGRKLDNEELHSLYSSPNIIRMIK
jgi:hypothetical protein